MKRRNGARSAAKKNGNNGSTATIEAEPRRRTIISASASMPEKQVCGREPTAREIRDRAYYIYLERGGNDGDPSADWIRAERELRQELCSAQSSRRF